MKELFCNNYEFIYSLIFLSPEKYKRAIASATITQLTAVLWCIQNYKIFEVTRSSRLGKRIYTWIQKSARTLIGKDKSVVEKIFQKNREIIVAYLAYIFKQVAVSEICLMFMEKN
jgi:hypothetical protein